MPGSATRLAAGGCCPSSSVPGDLVARAAVLWGAPLLRHVLRREGCPVTAVSEFPGAIAVFLPHAESLTAPGCCPVRVWSNNNVLVIVMAQTSCPVS